GRGSRAVSGRLVRAPRKGSVVVIEFSDGMHEYVTTPVKRVLRLASRDVFYIETVNSRYRLEVRDRERTLEDASRGWAGRARGLARCAPVAHRRRLHGLASSAALGNPSACR